MSNFQLDSSLHPYLKAMISKIPTSSKLVMKTLIEKPYNKEELSLNARVRRGELNEAITWVEALGLVEYTIAGRSKMYSVTTLGEEAYKEFDDIFNSQ
ncbi:hypothetical protein YDYSY3_39630 [Paenibacillus chitinolyticus]|uniref:hypothetical protein n=1 Tax=Paenibacillus chitinolyticus TaxID=79263 RepID=UPI0026E4A687|nr:hypothetical protein [Paenibacillus chitinolyticus]GKS12963.1 hypothetical protein YDYSY3_39630 [Paenibacillus chitinolyticus]